MAEQRGGYVAGSGGPLPKLPSGPAPGSSPAGDRPKRIFSDRFHEALLDAGIVARGDFVRRLVIVAEVGEPVMMYLERYGDERLVDVVRHMEGVEVREVARD